MPRYEYKVVPAPTKGLKARGVKGAEARFSHAIQELMNGLAGYGWEYQRAETLPSIERSGLTSTTTEWRNVLVFRRLRENDAEAFTPELLPPPENVAEPVEIVPQEASKSGGETPKESPKKPEDEAKAKPETTEGTPTETTGNQWDNGVEDTSDVEGVGSPLETLAAARNSTKSDT